MRTSIDLKVGRIGYSIFTHLTKKGDQNQNFLKFRQHSPKFGLFRKFTLTRNHVKPRLKCVATDKVPKGYWTSFFKHNFRKSLPEWLIFCKMFNIPNDRSKITKYKVNLPNEIVFAVPHKRKKPDYVPKSKIFDNCWVGMQ